jgi:tetratricopeptide (TPR) repeat protein
MLEALAGNFEGARSAIMSGAKLAEQLGLVNLRAGAIIRIAGEIELLAGDVPAAERFFRDAYETLHRSEDWGHLASVAPLLAHALLAQGRADEAEGLLDATARWAIEDDREAHIFLNRGRSKLAALRGDAAEAERYARTAVERAAEGDDINQHADAVVDLADALELGERRNEAHAALREALELYECKGNVVSAERVRQRLASDGA